jgi:hypothetical protein
MNDYMIPVIVTLVTAMTVGAIYLLTLLLSDGKPDGPSEGLAAFAESADTEAEAAAEAKADATDDAKH